MTKFIPNPDQNGDYKFIVQPLSSHERNRLFLQTGDNFLDASLVSGVDCKEDGRGFALIDYDRDGWLDIALTSPNKPKFRLFRNRMGDRNDASRNLSTMISLRGGATNANSQNEWSARDAIGASLLVTVGSAKRKYQLSAGEGLSSQNGNWIHVGMGKAELIDGIEVSWPSGKKTVHENIKAGERVTLFEDPSAKE